LTTSFSPALSEYASVRAFALVGGHLLIGGSFDTVNGESHRNLALLDKSSGDPVQSLNLQIDNGINTLQADGENILVGGDFMGVTGVLRPNEFAALDEGTGMATAWNPDIESGSTIHYHAGRIYYFNPYTTILGAVNATDGSPVAGWAPV